MERVMFGVLVLSGLCNFVSSLHYIQHHFINEPRTWAEAQQYCREKYTDLATVNDLQDLEHLAGLTESGAEIVTLGLYRDWGWSVSEADDYKEGEAAYWNWASGQPMTDNCGTIGPSGEWFTMHCGEAMNFFCYNGSITDISQRFTLVTDSMTWNDAQTYCRTWHSDLARVRNALENAELQGMMSDSSVWIGLTRMSWMWSDGSEPSFIPWRPSEPHLSGVADCGVLQVNSDPLGIVDYGCDTQHPFLCYGVKMRKQLMKLRLTAADSSVDMQDPVVMESVLKSVEQKLSDKGASVKVSWWRLPKKEENTKQEQTLTTVCVP